MIPQQKILRIFKLINLLKQPGGKSISWLASVLETSPRSIHRYLKLLEEIGLMVDKDFHGRYFLCQFDEQNDDCLYFTSEESLFLKQLILSTSSNHPLAPSLLKKVYVHGEIYTVPEYLEKAKLVRFVGELQKAIDQRLQVLLKNYHSAHSQEISDRLIEPFAFDRSYKVVQAYEPASEMTKFFKIERIADVVVIHKKQRHIRQHQEQHLDCFGFSGETRYRVQLEMSLHAFLLLREDYPGSIPYILKDNERDLYIFDGPVYQLEGVGRFILGSLDLIEVKKPDKLKEYIEEKICNWRLRHKLSKGRGNFDLK